MKLIRVHIISANTCGGLLDGLDLWLRRESCGFSKFDPLCFVGPNGSGKSQFLQVTAEAFQSVLHACHSREERIESNPDLQFELEYLVRSEIQKEPVHVHISRQATEKGRLNMVVQRKIGNEWEKVDLDDSILRELMPKKIVGYTSGENETLSLPFFVSRSGYADEVARRALHDEIDDQPVADTRLMLIDYGTHLEVLVANLLFGDRSQRGSLLEYALLKDLHSFRCIVQLAHSAVPKAAGKRKSQSPRKGIQLTEELESYIERLRRCATCHSYDEKTERYIFDYWINEQTRDAFRHFWTSTIDLYSSFHKLSMLNDLAIPKRTRERFRKDTKTRRFASRLPEPQDEDKVFRFERVSFFPEKSGKAVDYVSLSDGEHQLLQLIGTMCMISFQNVLFLLDEPESHFNPHWRTKTISRMLNQETRDGKRSDSSVASHQDCLLTTHAPFVPSDMPRDHVFIFNKKDGKIVVENPDVETYGTTFDSILEECFGVRPPISQVSMEEIDRLRKSNNPEEIKAGLKRLGDSVEKVFLADRLRQLRTR